MAISGLGFGLLTCQHHPADTRTDADIFRDAVELAVEAERVGFDSVWTSEHHFFDDGYMSSQLPVLGAIAARTSRILLGPCVVLLPLYEPIHLAEDVAAVDLLSNGRLVFGAGLGWRDEELEAFGVSSSDRVPRLEASLGRLRDAWSGRPTRGSDAISGRVRVTPLPARQGGPPIWLAAMVQKSARRAGRLADGFIATRVLPADLAVLVRAALDGLDAAGRQPADFTVSVHHPVFTWTGRDAWQRVAPYLHYVDWKYDDMTVAHARRIGSAAPPTIDQVRDTYLRGSCLWGSPERVAEGIVAYAEAAGSDVHFIARSYFPGMDPGVQRETMRLFAAEVMPLLRPRAAIADWMTGREHA